MGEFFSTFFIHPTINVLLVIYSAFSFLHIPYALGFAIIGLTIAIRFVMYPLTTSQLKASMKMQAVAPHLAKIKERYKGDNARIQQETLRLYKEQGINPAAGCLPVLIQMPIIWTLYSVLQHVVNLKSNIVVAEINKIVYFDFLKLHTAWDPTFFGLSLGAMPSNLVSTVGPLIFLVPILTGVLQFLLSKMMIPAKTGVAAIEKNIEQKEFEFRAKIFINSSKNDGIDIIKSILLEAQKNGLQVHYIAAPEYLVKMKTKNAKKGEKEFNAALESIEKSGKGRAEIRVEVVR